VSDAHVDNITSNDDWPESVHSAPITPPPAEEEWEMVVCGACGRWALGPF